MGIIRERDWIKYLPDEFALYFSLKTLLGQVVSFSVVLIKDDQCVARYDYGSWLRASGHHGQNKWADSFGVCARLSAASSNSESLRPPRRAG